MKLLCPKVQSKHDNHLKKFIETHDEVFKKQINS